VIIIFLFFIIVIHYFLANVYKLKKGDTMCEKCENQEGFKMVTSINELKEGLKIVEGVKFLPMQKIILINVIKSDSYGGEEYYNFDSAKISHCPYCGRKL
jgi:hypothetical protein